MDKTGIAVTTYNRPHVLDYTLGKMREAFDGYIVVIDDCSDTQSVNSAICTNYDAKWICNNYRLGIPRSKYEGFMNLLMFERQFWFDDDCYPLPGWLDRFKEAMEFQGHLLYLKDWAHIQTKQIFPNGLISYTNPTACFMSFRKDMYTSVGKFYEGFPKYGHWHNVLSHNMSRFGVDEYVSIEDASKYLYSFDLDHPPKDFNYSFQSSMSHDDRRKELKKFIHQ